MKHLRALLVGVTDYTAPAPAKEIATHRPSAALDVATVMELLQKICTGSGGIKLPLATKGSAASRRIVLPTKSMSSAEVWPLDSAADTTKASILKGLEWLFNDAGPDHQLLFYFSGHGLLRPAGLPGAVEEVLLPSDTDWKSRVIRDEDVFQLARRALSHGANFEVVLEACSAMAFYTPTAKTRAFGCFLGNGSNEDLPAAVWGAAAIGQSSWSAPVPADADAPIQGLFTHYFCKSLLAAKSRQGLLTVVGEQLMDHAKSRETKRCKGFSQTPGLYCSEKMSSLKPFYSSGAQNAQVVSSDCVVGSRRVPHL